MRTDAPICFAHFGACFPRLLALMLLAPLLAPNHARAEDEPAPPPSQTVWFRDLAGFPAEMPVAGAASRYFRVYANGLIAFDGRLEQALVDSPAPLSEMQAADAPDAPGVLVAALWNPMGGVCEGAPVNDGRNDISVAVDDGTITILWSRMTRRAEACVPDPPTSTFSARLSWPEVSGGEPNAQQVFRVEFDYGFGEDDLATAGEPRAGIVADELVMELLPDEGKRRTGRAASLAQGGSGDVRPGEELGDPDAGAGYWVIEVDADGELFGDEGDGIRAGDNCPADPNPRQRDLDRDGHGDACDDDIDGDDTPDLFDNCPRVANGEQVDADEDGVGDRCDADRDGDTIPNGDDNCPDLPNPGQFDLDWDGRGDACDTDPDGDGVAARDAWGVHPDTCPWLFDPDQGDKDGDGLGDACDSMPSDAGPFGRQADADGDRVPDLVDLCPVARDPWQTDADRDGIGDACDADVGNDGKPDVLQGRCHSTPSGIVGDCVFDVDVDWREWRGIEAVEGLRR